MTRRFSHSFIRTLFYICVFLIAAGGTLAQSAEQPAKVGSFRIGERLTYNVSFEKYKNVVFIETDVLSRGAISKREAIELRLRIKTEGLVNTLFSSVDEERTVFAAPETGQPLLIKRTFHGGIVPKVVETNLLASGSGAFDLLTALFKARETGGNGSFQLVEDDENSTVTFAASGSERIKTDAGDFDASIATVVGTYFESRGIQNLRVWFSNDADHVPVAFAFKTAKGDFNGRLAGMIVEQTPSPETLPTPSASPTPIVKPTPRPTATPAVYVDNQPLLPELGFQLGEQLEYKVTQAGKPVGTITLSASDRKLVGTQDILRLTARATGVDGGIRPFGLGDAITALVNPDSLGPRSFEAKLTGGLASLSQSVTFDQRNGTVIFGANKVDGPIGVHSLLSLIYAMRSFNLKPSKDLSNPVNDTRVAVFWLDKVYIFTLRPDVAKPITIGDQKLSAQMITINTGNAALDQLGLKVYLSTEDGRQPLRFTVGSYQADLISSTIVPPR